MSRKIEMTIPDLVWESLRRKGALLELTPGEVIKQVLLVSGQGVELGFNLAGWIDEIRKEGATVTAVREDVDLALETEG
jgi:hypothetical protein